MANLNPYLTNSEVRNSRTLPIDWYVANEAHGANTYANGEMTIKPQGLLIGKAMRVASGEVYTICLL